MLSRLFLPLVLFFVVSANAQQVINPRASVLDVAARQAQLRTTSNPLLRSAMKTSHSCTATLLVPAPPRPIDIPHHYLADSHGPTNPAEREATRIYAEFEKRITAGMNQYVATGSHAEAACALQQLDAWARALALLEYNPKESSQAWFQVEWTLSSAAIVESVLVNDAALDAEQQKRVLVWLDAAAHKLISFEKPGTEGNNHHYWRALAATAVGVTAKDNMLFQFGVTTYKQAVGQLDSSGAFPLEMARHERASHYQGFALQPLILIAEFAARQGTDLYAYSANGHTLHDAIVFFGRSVDDPSLIKPYATEEQAKDFGPDDFAPFVFYAARFPTEPLPPAITNALKRPLTSTRIGGNTTILAAP